MFVNYHLQILIANAYCAVIIVVFGHDITAAL